MYLHLRGSVELEIDCFTSHQVPSGESQTTQNRIITQQRLCGQMKMAKNFTTNEIQDKLNWSFICMATTMNKKENMFWLSYLLYWT